MRVKYPSNNAKGDLTVTIEYINKALLFLYVSCKIALLNDFQQAKPSAPSAWKDSNANSLGMECR